MHSDSIDPQHLNLIITRHPHPVIPAEAGIQGIAGNPITATSQVTGGVFYAFSLYFAKWIPAFAGMTVTLSNPTRVIKIDARLRGDDGEQAG